MRGRKMATQWDVKFEVGFVLYSCRKQMNKHSLGLAKLSYRHTARINTQNHTELIYVFHWNLAIF